MDIINIANTYLTEHEELPLLIVAKNEADTRIIQGHFREKHAQADQATFVNVMRLAMIIYDYTSYEFIVKPEFNYEALQMTKNVWAVGHVSPTAQSSEFFVIENDELVPYFEEMPIGGYIAQLLPSEVERSITLNPKVVAQIKMYVENSTYKIPIKVEREQALDGLEELFAHYQTA